jgi:hypothetical protein
MKGWLRITTVVAAGLLLAGVTFAVGHRGPQSASSSPAQSSESAMGHMMDSQPMGSMGQMMNNLGQMMNNQSTGQMMNNQSMMQMHQNYQKQWKTMDAELDKLVAEMNAAPEGKKLDAMAAVINKLVEQRRAMHDMRSNMQMQMMHRMDQMSGMSRMHGMMYNR